MILSRASVNAAILTVAALSAGCTPQGQTRGSVTFETLMRRALQEKIRMLFVYEGCCGFARPCADPTDVVTPKDPVSDELIPCDEVLAEINSGVYDGCAFWVMYLEGDDVAACEKDRLCLALRERRGVCWVYVVAPGGTIRPENEVRER
jgi:hypothetical protein